MRPLYGATIRRCRHSLRRIADANTKNRAFIIEGAVSEGRAERPTANQAMLLTRLARRDILRATVF